jgi:hypothetical protein
MCHVGCCVACFGRSFTKRFCVERHGESDINPPHKSHWNGPLLRFQCLQQRRRWRCGITGVNSAIDSAPCIRPNQCLKRQLSQLTHDDDGDPDDELFRSYQESTVAHRLVHSSERGTISIPLHSTSGWPSAHTKPTTIIPCQTMSTKSFSAVSSTIQTSIAVIKFELDQFIVSLDIVVSRGSWSSWR